MINKLGYIYTCPDCGVCTEDEKFSNSDGYLVCDDCKIALKLSQPKHTVEYYKGRRKAVNLLTFLFAVILPLIAVCCTLFIKSDGAPTHLKLNFLGIVIISLLIFKGKHLFTRIIQNTDNSTLRYCAIIIEKCYLWLILIVLTYIIWRASKSWETLIIRILLSLSLTAVFQAIAYTVFDLRYLRYTYIIERAERQMETIQAIDIRNDR